MAEFCVWEDCDQKASYCEGHAHELVNPLGVKIEYAPPALEVIDGVMSDKSQNADWLRARFFERSAEVDEYQQHEDEIIVALGSQGILPSEIVSNIERLTAEGALLRKALDDLIALKDYRDWHGKTPDYLEKKPLAWQQARDALVSGSQCQHEWEHGIGERVGDVWTCHKCEEFTLIDPADSRLCTECGGKRGGHTLNCTQGTRIEKPSTDEKGHGHG